MQQMRWMLLLVVQVTAFTRIRRCPGSCRCFTNRDPEQTITVDCSNQDLVEIPYPLPNRTSNLDASGNLIQYVRSIDFSTRDTYLRILQLQNNDLLEIQSRAFKRLPNLQTLFLSNNNRLGARKEIHPEVFYNLRRLKLLNAMNLGLRTLPANLFDPLREVVEIDLSHNDLTEISSGYFSDLPRLRKIRLNNNFISDLQASSFSNLPTLVELDLSDNDIHAITNAAFSGLPRIRNLILTGNPIECACCVTYLHGFISMRRLPSPICQSPPQFEGIPLLSLRLEDICLAPSVTLLPEETILVLPADTVLDLQCNATGVPPPAITWSREGRSLESDGTHIVIMDDLLFVLDVNVSDSGTYHCSASSSAGMLSMSRRVLVLEEIPATEVRVVLRDDLILPCGNQTLPSATPIQWFFDGSRLPLASDQYVVLQNGSLLLRRVELGEDANYTCEVGGQINYTTTVFILAPPEVLSINQGDCSNPNVIVVSTDNEEFVLSCVVLGIPTPSVRWIVPGLPVESVITVDTTGRIVEANYTIIDLGFFDFSGNYTCIANNSLGVASRTIELRQLLVRMQIGTLPTITAVVGDNVVLDCPLNTSTVVWTMEIGDPVVANQLRSFACPNNQALIIRDVSLTNDSGLFICQSPQTGEELTRTLIITEEPEIVHPCPVPRVTAILGRNVTLDCPASGNPAVNWEWTRSGRVILTGGRVTLLNRGAMLLLTDVEANDADLYTCTVRNSIFNETYSDSYTIQLDVQAPLLRPYFTYRPYSVTALTGMVAMLPCGGGGNPLPNVTWKRLSGGPGLRYTGSVEEVTFDERVSITSTSLLFSEVELDDEGFYFCVISSPLGVKMSNFVLFNVIMPPEVLVSPRSVEIAQGSSVELECNGTGDPLPDIQWLLLPNMVLLPSPDHPNYIVNGTNLLISSASAADTGMFRCWVANTGGQVVQDVSVTVIAPPTTSVFPSSVTANIGCQVTLTCLDGDLPPANFHWFKGNVQLQNSSEVLIRSNGQLILSDVRFEDAGNYTCVVQGTYQNASDEAVVLVQDPLMPPPPPPSKPFILSPTPSLQVVDVDQPVQFICHVDGFPSPDIVWLKDEVVLEGVPGVEVFRNEVLFIANARRADQGSYVCWAFNVEGNASETFELLIAAAPEIVSVPNFVEIGEYLILNLTCVATGVPRPDISWFINDEQILNDERHMLEPSTGSLIIVNVSLEEDSGRYTCFAWNDAGIDQHTFLVEVIGIITPLSLRVPPASVVKEEGSYVVLDCVVDGFPPPTITWTRDGVPIPACPTSDDVCVAEGDYIYIPSAKPRDSGLYTCRAERFMERRTYAAYVTVSPRNTVPLFTVYPVPLFIKNGTTATINCSAEGSPRPTIRWKRNRRGIASGTIGFTTHPNGSLTIMNADSDSAGLFTCCANNGFSLSEITVLVDVTFTSSSGQLDKSTISPPSITSTPIGSVSLSLGQSITLDCEASGHPEPSISWTKNDQATSFNSLPNVNQAHNGSLVLTEVNGEEEGKYDCKAINDEGQYRSSFFLQILANLPAQNSRPASVASQTRSSVTAIMGGEVRLDCDEPLASEATEVLWRHNGVGVCGERVWIDGNGSLILSHVVLEDGGKYQCLVYHSKGFFQSDVLLVVLPRKEPPYFLVSPSDSHVVKTNFLVLPCLPASPGGEETHLEWFHDHTALTKQGVKHVVLKNGSLLLTNVFPAQAGNYSCQASNIYGRSLVTAMVTVSKTEVDMFVAVREGSSLLLSCEVGEGDGVKWVKDKNAVSSFAGMLWFSEVNQSHSGEYSCSLNKNSFNYFITVQVPPKILGPSTTVVVSLGSMASLDCMATGRPRPNVTWHHDGLQIERDQKYSVLANGTLLLYGVNKEDGGSYICRATNPQGYMENRLLLLVDE